MRNPIKLTRRLYSAVRQAYINRGRAFQCHWLNMKPHPLCWVGEPCSPNVRVVLQPHLHAKLCDIPGQPWPTKRLELWGQPQHAPIHTHTHTRINLRLPHLVDGSTAGKSRRKPTVKRWKILILHTVEPDVELPLANGNATPAGSFPAVEWNKMTSK